MSAPSIPLRPLTVSELNREIRETLESAFGAVWVAGEVTNLRRPASGHIYLSLKDTQAQISAVMWRGPAARLPFNLQDGLEVIAEGEITVYEPRGQYQIVLRHIQPKGVGALQLAFIQLKEKREKAGLFAPERKRPLPFIPSRIGIVTSPSGAAIHDMLRTIYTRFPAARVLVCPARVQGQGAAEEIAAAIAALNRVPDVDVIIAGRGGGSLEDLWAFNEEIVARAIAASRAPVISAVGHEIDVTISDLVADCRALTPTDAGRIVVPELTQIQENLDGLRRRLAHSLRRRVAHARERLTAVSRGYAFRRPLDRIRQLEQRVDTLGHRMACSAASRLPMLRQRLKALQGRLDALSPQRVLSRGYSITLHSDGRVVRAAAEAQPGAVVRTRLHDGQFQSQIIP